MTTRNTIMPTALRRACWMLVVLGVLVPGRAVLAAGTWTSLANTAPGSVQLMLLLSDGTVMAANPWANSAYQRIWYKLTPDSNGSYVNGTWTTLASMANTRLYYSSAILQDGRLFVAGGEFGTGGWTAEVYDPLTNIWTTTSSAAPLLNPGGNGFFDSMSKILPNGDMLVGPVAPAVLRNTLTYTPSTDTWASADACSGSQNEASWVKLPDDSILTVDLNTTNSERYIPATGQWNVDANVEVQLYSGSELGAALLLPDGRAFFLGGTGNTALYTPTGDTSLGSWVPGTNIPNNPSGNPQGTPDAPAAMMVNGKILCAVCRAPYVDGSGVFQVFNQPTRFYEYDYTVGATGSFTQVNSPTGGLTDNVQAYKTCMLDLPDGNVLYSHRGSQLYIYQPDGVPLAAGKPAISTLSTNADGSFHLTGTLLNGISEGAAYGDNAQMDTNYPLVRLTSGAGVVTYARTHDWSSTSVQTGSETVTTEFTLPTGVFRFVYSLVVVANGISSDPISFAGPVWVDFNFSGIEIGSFDLPFSTLVAGRDNVQTGGTIMIKGPASSLETLTISTPMTLVAVGGTVTIGG